MKRSFKRITAIAVCFTLALTVFAPLAVSADGTVVYQMATDSVVQALTAGTEIDSDYGFDGAFLMHAGDITARAINSRYGGIGIAVSNRSDSWQGIDILAGGSLGREGITLSGAEYTIRVRGTVSGNLPFQLAGGDDPWTGFFGETVSGDFSIEHTFTEAGIMGNGFAARGHIRINNTGNSTPDFEIHEIVIVRGDSIPEELPGGAPAADEPTLGDVPADEVEEPADEPAVEVPTPELPPVVVPDGGTVIQLTVGSTAAFVNGDRDTLDAAPFVAEGNRTMVPFRFIGEAMGATVEWVRPVAGTHDGIARFTLDGNTIDLPIGVALADDMGTPVIVDNRTFVPVRFVSENMGGVVGWDGPTQTVTITVN